MYDKKGAAGGNGVGRGPAMLIAGIFPAPRPFDAQPPVHVPSHTHTDTRCAYVFACVLCPRKWSFYSVRKFRLSAAVPALRAQRAETFALGSLNVHPGPLPRARLLAPSHPSPYFLPRLPRIFLLLAATRGLPRRVRAAMLPRSGGGFLATRDRSRLLRVDFAAGSVCGFFGNEAGFVRARCDVNAHSVRWRNSGFQGFFRVGC